MHPNCIAICSVTMKHVRVILIILWNLNAIYGQFSFGCPSGWELHNNRCYLFEIDFQRIYEEADTACWVNGATLLSINDYKEHMFVSDWLMKHDPQHGSVWFTSGFLFEGALVWDVDSTFGVPGLEYWAAGHPPSSDEVFSWIAYVKGGHFMSVDGYGWKVVSKSIVSAYICEMSKQDAQERNTEHRDFTYGQGTSKVKDIERGPIIDQQPASIVVFGEPPVVYIECKATANPNPTYTWHREPNQAVTTALSNRYTLSAGRFAIQNPKDVEDDGLYQCMAENKIGKVLSNPARIIFGYLQSFSPVKPDDVQANKFEGTRISCESPAAFPETAFSWFTTSIADPIFHDHESIFVSNSGYLYFSSVQPTDHRWYYCSVTLITSSEYETVIDQPPSRVSLGVELIVTGTEHGYIKPYIYTHIFPSPARRGSQIRLECIAYGSLPLVYSWRREDGRVFEPRITFSDLNRVLTIDDASLEDEGNYVCTVNGRVGVTSNVITLSIEAKPYFPFGIGHRLADPGQNLKWRCMAVARPPAEYTWYKNGKAIMNNQGVIEVKRNYLMIYNVDKQRDEGMYQCGASNIIGSTFSYGQLKILSFKPTFDKNPMVPFLQIPLGGNYTIPCGVEAAPVPGIEWLKNGGVLPLTPGEISGHLGMALDNSLVIITIEYSDEAAYTCKASNVNGEAMNTTTVQVVRGISIANTPLDTRVQVNRTAFLFCQASYDSLNYDLTYMWKFNGHLIDMKINPHYIQSKRDGQDGLYIRDAQFKHAGEYTCEARTTLHIASRAADLYVDGPPGAPAGVYVQSSSVYVNSVRLIWTITSDVNHGNPINRYDVEAEVGLYPGIWNAIVSDILETASMSDAVNSGFRVDQRSAVIGRLLPNIDYSFRVRAINDFGRGHEASWGSVYIRTPAMAPVAAPRNIRGLAEGKVGTLNIVWDALGASEYSGSGVGYNVFFKKKGDPKEWLHAKMTGADSTMYTHLVGEDNFYLEYSVMVGAYNIHGNGPNSSVYGIMSAESMPIATVVMGDCDNYNGSAFTMSWTPIEDTRDVMKGRLKGYRLRYWHSDFPEFITWRDVYGQHEGAIIIGVQDNTNYWASVQVMNYAGVGPIGEIRLAETLHLPPVHYPRHVKVWPHAAHSIRVTWQGVSTLSNAEESLEGYILRVWKIQEDIRTAKDVVVDKVAEAIIDNLQVQTVYVLRMLGYSLGGDGSLSPHVYFTVEGGNVPFDPTTTRFCFSQQECDSASLMNYSLFLLFMLPALYSIL